MCLREVLGGWGGGLWNVGFVRRCGEDLILRRGRVGLKGSEVVEGEGVVKMVLVFFGLLVVGVLFVDFGVFFGVLFLGNLGEGGRGLMMIV